MNKSLLRACAALAVLGALLLMPLGASAQNVTCNVTSMGNVAFGNVDPTSSQTDAIATLSYSCTNFTTQQRSARMCISIGEPNGGPSYPRQMSSGTNVLQFQLYQDPARSIIWGSDGWPGNPGGGWTSDAATLTIPASQTRTGSMIMYARVIGGQTGASPGAYLDSYTFNDTAISVNQQTGTTAPSTCSGTMTNGPFTFSVSATITKNCTVSAATLDFGTINGFLTANVDQTTTLQTTCTSGTPYKMGLDNGQNANGTTRRMAGPAGEYTTYELYRDSGRTLRWGNDTTNGTDTVNDSGNGLAKTNTIYGRVAPQATPAPGSYSDTITVYVTY